MRKFVLVRGMVSAGGWTDGMKVFESGEGVLSLC